MMIRFALFAIASMFLAASAQAQTLDFEAQAGGYGYYPYSFVEDGFQIDYAPISPFGFYILDDPADHLGMCSPSCASNGTTALYAFNESSVTISLLGGGLFSLESLDAAQTFTGNNRPLTLTLTGTGTAGVVTTTIFVNAQDAEAFSTFSFDSFANLSSLTITGSQDFPEFAIDNVVLSSGAVPEPAAWATMMAGFGVAGGTLRRRRGLLRFA